MPNDRFPRVLEHSFSRTTFNPATNKTEMTRGPKPKPLAVRFWKKVKKGRADECWIWTGSSSHGYGGIWVLEEGRFLGAHVVSWMMHNKKPAPPPGVLILHSCDTGLCVNPRHLSSGSSKDNLQDMARKGRSTRGEKSHHAKLTEAAVKEIRNKKEWKRGDTKVFCEKFGVREGTIKDVRKRTTWRHIE